MVFFKMVSNVMHLEFAFLQGKITLLVAAIVLTGLIFLPQAKATVYDLGTIVPGNSTAQPSDSVAANKSFQDFFDLKSTGLFSLNATGNSVVTAGTGNQLTSFNLYLGDHTTLVATGNIYQFDSAGVSFYASLVYATPLLANQTYSIGVGGQSLAPAFGTVNTYSLSLTTASVREPGEWLMLLIGIGLVSYQVFRKQKVFNLTEVRAERRASTKF